MSATNQNTENLALVSWIWIEQTELPSNSAPIASQPLIPPTPVSPFDPFLPIRHWLDGLTIENPALAHRICRLIPAQCPFERELKLFGRTVVRIPPLCKLNPVYEQVVALRFRALCYLADDCGEDISQYC